MARESGEAGASGGSTAFLGAWRRASRLAVRTQLDLTNTAVRNLAIASGLGTPGSTNGSGRRPAALPETAYSDGSWSFERSTDGEIVVGDTVSFTKRIREREVADFAHASGDTNRLHLDDSFARRTRFGGRIVHGSLVSGLISAALARLPGLTIYLSQNLEFRAPVEIGAELTAECEVLEVLEDDRYRLETVVRDTETTETVIEGEAVVLIDELPLAGD